VVRGMFVPSFRKSRSDSREDTIVIATYPAAEQPAAKVFLDSHLAFFIVVDLRGSSMQLSNPFKTVLSALVALAAVYMGSSFVWAQNQSNPAAEARSQACPNDESELELPAGFCATVFADDMGHARHRVVASSGVLYVNTRSGSYYGNDTPHPGGFLVALKDKSGAGKADVIDRFGETVQSGGAGGTVRSMSITAGFPGTFGWRIGISRRSLRST
jgi:hypothetical protein